MVYFQGLYLNLREGNWSVVSTSWEAKEGAAGSLDKTVGFRLMKCNAVLPRCTEDDLCCQVVNTLLKHTTVFILVIVFRSQIKLSNCVRHCWAETMMCCASNNGSR